MPEAERKLWARLRNHQQDGWRFRRQHSIGPYVADFVCIEARLVVELDGGQHYEDPSLAYDRRRDAFMESEGWTVLRVNNRDVYVQIDDVLDGIVRAAQQSAALVRVSSL